jgi:hypothetical protein
MDHAVPQMRRTLGLRTILECYPHDELWKCIDYGAAKEKQLIVSIEGLNGPFLGFHDISHCRTDQN